MSRQKDRQHKPPQAPAPAEAVQEPTTPQPDVSKEPEALIEQLRQEIARVNDRHLRTLAEFDNTRKRLQREKDEFARYAAEGLVRRLLPIVDSLDQALIAVKQQHDSGAVTKGVELIAKQLTGLLEREGVKRIATVGEIFDPHQHEAVAQVEARDGQRDHTIVEEIQGGYTMHGKVIRPAMVKVAKQSADSTQQTAEDTLQQSGEESNGKSDRD